MSRTIKAYDSVALMVRWPYEYQARWVVKRNRFICQWRARRDKGRWEKWRDA